MQSLRGAGHDRCSEMQSLLTNCHPFPCDQTKAREMALIDTESDIADIRWMPRIMTTGLPRVATPEQSQTLQVCFARRAYAGPQTPPRGIYNDAGQPNCADALHAGGLMTLELFVAEVRSSSRWNYRPNATSTGWAFEHVHDQEVDQVDTQGAHSPAALGDNYDSLNPTTVLRTSRTSSFIWVTSAWIESNLTIGRRKASKFSVTRRP